MDKRKPTMLFSWHMPLLISGLLLDFSLFLSLSRPVISWQFSAVWQSKAAGVVGICLSLLVVDSLLILCSMVLRQMGLWPRFWLSLLRCIIRLFLVLGQVAITIGMLHVGNLSEKLRPPAMCIALALALLLVSIAEVLETRRTKQKTASEAAGDT